MASPSPQSKVIDRAARDALRPIGLRRKGRSRIWLDDRGWWVGVVEFQPHGHRRGSFLNVGATWLWSEGQDHVSFDVGGRVDGLGRQLVEYESDEQYAPEAAALAAHAVAEIDQLRATLPEPAAAAQWLARNGGLDGWWPAFHLGIALGVAGRHDDAIAQLRRLPVLSPDGPPFWQDVLRRADEYAALLETDPSAFDRRIDDAIAAFRAALRLDPIEAPGGIATG